MFEDSALRDEPCGQTTHLWKYAFFNTGFTVFSVMTYLLYPGGGEAARARAVLCTILHLAFVTWLILMFFGSSRNCVQVVSNKFGTMYWFLWMCLVHNSMFGGFYLVHEAWLSFWIGKDLTLIAEIRVLKGKRSYSAPQGSVASDILEAVNSGPSGPTPQPYTSQQLPDPFQGHPEPHLQGPAQVTP